MFQLLACIGTLLCTVAAVPLEEFYPFGESAGDVFLRDPLSGSTGVDNVMSDSIPLRRVFPFYGDQHSVIVSLSLAIL